MKVYSSPVKFQPNYGIAYEAEQKREAAHQAELKTWLKDNGYGGANTGRVASFPVADGAALYMIGEGTGSKKDILVHLPYGDGYNYVHVSRLTKKDILASARHDEAVAKLSAKRAGWWAGLKVGATVHYDNGFGEFVRGVIVKHKGENKMRPTALVGGWKAHDLPKRMYTGEVICGTYASRLRGETENEPMQPNSANMFESPDYCGSGKGKADPAKMKPLDLSDPVDTPEYAAARKATSIKNALMAALGEDRDGPEGWSAQVPKGADEATYTRAYTAWLLARLEAAKTVLA